MARGTLRDLGGDRLAFGHDVLRDWTVARLLHMDPDRLDRLPLDGPVPATLARGVELAARLALERGDDARAWTDHLARIGGAGAHPSWRRWSLLAVLRSEIAPRLLDRVAGALLDSDEASLSELIRTALAVESRPLADLLSEHGLEAPEVASRVFVPSNGSWVRLALWLLARRAEVPPACLIDVVELFGTSGPRCPCRTS